MCAGRGDGLGAGDMPCRRPRRENAENMYYFSELALTLNEHEEGVAPTDSRLRPDQRLMEKGQWDEANTEKQRLEEKQRLWRRRRAEACSRGCSMEDGEGARREGRGCPRERQGGLGAGSLRTRGEAACPPPAVPAPQRRRPRCTRRCGSRGGWTR